MKTAIKLILTAAVSVAATWFLASLLRPAAAHGDSASSRKVLYYQSAMHPWIKSDKPGRCTICGMELTPVYEGEKGFDDSGSGDVTTLSQTQIRVLQVRTGKVRKQPLVRTLRVSGTIDDDETRHRVLASYLDGRIDRLHVTFAGAEVTAGQPLAGFYSPDLLQAEREYRQLGGDLKQQAALRLRQMGLSREQIAAVDAKAPDALISDILAPIGGTVVSKSVSEGQYVSTGQTLFEIADFSTMWFKFQAYERDMPFLKTGLKVNVTTPSLPGRTITGTIAFIDPNFDEATRSTKVRVELPNPLVNGRRELSHRLYADGVVEMEAPDVLTVPRSAVLDTGSGPVAYVALDGGAFERRVLKVGRIGDTVAEVLAGLTDGEAVVTNGNLLIDGQAEMNRNFAAPQEPISDRAPDHGASHAAVDATALAAFLKTADSMAAALGADDLDGFNRVSEPATRVTADLAGKLADSDDKWSALAKASHFHGFKDLKSARIAFHRFSVAAVVVLEPMRKDGNNPAFEIYECGMVDEAIPGVPRKARWIQTGGRKLANPFFGSEMPDCGTTIHP